MKRREHGVIHGNTRQRGLLLLQEDWASEERLPEVRRVEEEKPIRRVAVEKPKQNDRKFQQEADFWLQLWKRW